MGTPSREGRGGGTFEQVHVWEIAQVGEVGVSFQGIGQVGRHIRVRRGRTGRRALLHDSDHRTAVFLAIGTGRRKQFQTGRIAQGTSGAEGATIGTNFFRRRGKWGELASKARLTRSAGHWSLGDEGGRTGSTPPNTRLIELKGILTGRIHRDVRGLIPKFADRGQNPLKKGSRGGRGQRKIASGCRCLDVHGHVCCSYFLQLILASGGTTLVHLNIIFHDG